MESVYFLVTDYHSITDTFIKPRVVVVVNLFDGKVPPAAILSIHPSLWLVRQIDCVQALQGPSIPVQCSEETCDTWHN